MVHLNYESMLYLDKTSFKVLKSVNPDFLEEYDIDTVNIFFEYPEAFAREIPVNFSKIEQLFSNNDTLKNTFARLNNITLDDRHSMIIQNNIYIKDHQKAIVTIHFVTWSITYRIILLDQKLRFEELYQIME